MLMFLWLLDGLMTFTSTMLPAAIERENQEEASYKFYALIAQDHREYLARAVNPDPEEVRQCQAVLDAHHACLRVRGKWYLDWLYIQRKRKTIALASSFISTYMAVPIEP